MSQQSIDGLLLKEMVIAGANLLEQNREAIDALNVFPVPDGDTGTNMSLTMKSTVKEIAAVDEHDASKLLRAAHSRARAATRALSFLRFCAALPAESTARRPSTPKRSPKDSEPARTRRTRRS